MYDIRASEINSGEITGKKYSTSESSLAFFQEEESGGSSTDMSICRSEVLFSSMQASGAAGAALLAPPAQHASPAAGGAAAAVEVPQLRDSLQGRQPRLRHSTKGIPRVLEAKEGRYNLYDNP